MPNTEEIIIKFKPEGDEKLIRAINKLATAQGKLNTSSEKTKKQFSKVNAAALKMIGSFKSNQEAITKLGLSQKILTKALRGNSDAVALVTARYQIYTGAMKRARKHTRILGGTMSVLRSKLLIVSFALGMVARGVMTFVKTAGDIAEIENKFDVVFGGSADSVSKFLDVLADSTGRSVHQLKDLSANIGAILIPMGATADQTAKMSTGLAQVAVDMSSLKNIAVADVMRDFSSAMVGNSETVLKYGINVKEGALQTEAFKLGITDSIRELSEGEKILTRFKTIVGQSAVAEGDAVATKHQFNNALQEAGATMENLKKSVGGVLIPMATAVLNIFNDFNIKRIVAYSAALVAVALSVTKVRKAIKGLTLAMTTNPYGALIVAGLALIEMLGLLDSKTEEVSTKTQTYGEIINSVNGQIGDNIKLAQEQLDILKEHLQTIEDSEHSLELELRQLLAKDEVTRRLIALDREFSAEEHLLIKLIVRKQELIAQEKQDAKDLIAHNKELMKAKKALANSYISDLKKAIDEVAKAQGRANKSFDDFMVQSLVKEGFNENEILQLIKIRDAEEELLEMKKKLVAVDEGDNLIMSNAEAEAMLLAIEYQEEYIANLEKILALGGEVSVAGLENSEMLQLAWDTFNQTASLYFSSQQTGWNQEMQAMKNGDEYLKASSKKKAELVKNLEDKQRSGKEKAWKQQQWMTGAGIVSDTAGAIMSIWKDVPKGDGGIWAGILTAFVTTLGLAQLSIVAGQNMPSFAKGGIIGGRRHSQGGTVIEAEQGEFVMSRNAVDAIGIESMNRINAGGGAGAVNINFTGNVMSQDFIEDEAIPMIKEAIRRGADIGVT